MDNLNYAIIGNCKSAALISDKGSIDWCCLPDFNSPSVFAKILDENRGGSFEILVDDSYQVQQSYVRTTNIVSTLFKSGNDCFEVFDFMPRYLNGSGYYNPAEIIRYFKYISGNPAFRLKYDPRVEYARFHIRLEDEDEYIKCYTTEGDYDSMYLYTDFNKQDILQQNTIYLKQDGFALMSYDQKLLSQTLDRQYLKLQKTKVYWLEWANKLTSYAKYNHEIIRSALVLKLLSYDKTGAVLAAVTTSLPETIGEERNWDYRFCWIRDASMVIKVMSSLGHLNTVKRFMRFIIDIIPDKDEKIQIMYGINREKVLTEETLDHLSGYLGSSPVRVGNAAYLQKQNDIYGILVDVIYQQFTDFKISLEDSEALWTIVRSIVRIVENNWQKPDKGIWEIRTDEKHFTFSKVLCWVAIDRAIKIAGFIHKDKYVKLWEPLADTIRNEILEKAWNEEMGAFTQFYGSDDLDAATLLMESYGFIDARDARYVQTVKATEKELCVDGLMYRYRNRDDFGLPSSSFTICTFWQINALNAIGEKKRAKAMFEQLLSYSNHVGLFSEDIDFKTKRLLGNFPQAYSHLALIETAINLAKGELTEDEKILEAIQ
ncbi:glycoside hydrolase family 15 protein [Maribellus sp. CM-23]|uniref:glycoside hydrolase family 15 protein n=1 Tax=Maribellus sp. CM-23 TaxID=2781026 RepID=UPI001F37AE69|nr:glycoside hydrolase family 15 protein [Maribellus sp. CM-23]MCE4566854.1 glycoside hydrolase family 15 protein [Maribellus sp. CM-23]